MWKFIKDGNTVSYFVTGYGRFYNTASDVYWMWKFIRDVYTVSYFVTGYGSL